MSPGTRALGHGLGPRRRSACSFVVEAVNAASRRSRRGPDKIMGGGADVPTASAQEATQAYGD